MEELTEKQESQVDYKNKWYVVLAVGSGAFLATIDGSIVNVSLPTITASLKTNFATIQWVVLAYLLTVATLMLSIGRLGDILGKKRIYMLGFAVFTIASIFCGLASHVYTLIGLRIVQGIGASMIMALGAAIITEAFPENERGKALGIMGAVIAVGIVTGPALGGLVIDLLSWHWIFFMNIPVGITGIWMVWRFIPDFKPLHKQRFDALGASILFACLSCLLIGLSLGQQRGFSHSTVLALLPASLVLMLVFIWIENHVEQPMIQLGLFKNPLLCVNLFTGWISFVAIGGIFILFPFYLSIILGYPTMKVGLLMSVIPISLGIFSPLAGGLSDRWGGRPIIILGLVVLFFGYLASSTLTTQTTAAEFMMRIVWIGVGTGLFVSPNNSAIMGAGPKEHLGIVSGLMAMSRTLGQTVGIAVIGTLWAVRVRTLTGNWDLKDITKAPAAAQVEGLQFVFILVALMILVGLCLSIYGYVLDKKFKKRGDG